MGQQFRAEPLVQPIRLRIHSLPVNTELEKVESHRLFKIGNDKRGKTQARVWIDTPNDDTKVFLYRHSEKDSDPNKDVFVCIQCSRHNRVTKFEIRRTENEDLELWEQPTHYPSCYRIKEEIESIQAKYERTSMNNSMNGTSIENSFNTSQNSFGSSKPRTKNNDYHYIGHRVVPETDYVFGVNEKGSIKSRILVRDEFNPALGRVYSFHPAKRADGRSIFYCRNCNPKKYAPVTVGDEDGEFTVREAPLARHELNCLPVSFDELMEKQQQLEEKLQRCSTA
uniref:Uncharacterized protein n=1 Tax=Panagrolaimus davidi TaxID=227884 RepID=A0A914R0P4_9BILA